jgi:predicted dehydrogenase
MGGGPAGTNPDGPLFCCAVDCGRRRRDNAAVTTATRGVGPGVHDTVGRTCFGEGIAPMKSKSRRTTRRTFMKEAITTGSALAALSQFGCASPGERKSEGVRTQGVESGQAPAGAAASPKTYKELRVAFIGTGGMGASHVNEMTDLGVTCLCFCDVDTSQWASAEKSWPGARGYQDYRQMFDKEHKNFDAVMIGTPDHHHYPATMLALQHGKHVYTQKPLTHTPWEARQLAGAMARYKVATQMGNQGHALQGWRLVYEWVNSGKLGTIKEVHTWTDRPIWPQGVERPEGEDPVPSSLNWDVWLGPAPVRPYKKDTYHQFAWRGWWDFGAGALGDMACHTMDGLFWALDPGYPTVIEPVATTAVNNETFPKVSILRWEFPRKGLRPGFVAYWYDGGLVPRVPDDLELGRHLPATGNLFVGSKATLLVSGDYGESPRIIPETKMQKIGKPKQMLDRSPGHYREWVMACVGEKPIDYPKSNFNYAAPMTESILLGNIALKVGRRLEWDGVEMKFTNDAEANQYVSKEYRQGWKF